MLPTLSHIPARSIVHIPGPPVIGSRKATVDFGYSGGHRVGLPTGDQIVTWQGDTLTPVWFAVSDEGRGFIPWGFWQVAIYVNADIPPVDPSNLALVTRGVSGGEPSAAVMGLVWGAFKQLQAAAVAAGFLDAAKIIITDAVFDSSAPNPNGTVRLEAPFGVTHLDGFYNGPLLPIVVGGDESVERVAPMQEGLGWDNPLVLALWSPGNRALIRAVEAPGPTNYPGYPYPGNPPPPEIIG